jgi:serine/threonine protein kinase
VADQKFASAAVATALKVDDVKYLGTGTYGESWLAYGRAVKIFHNAGYSLDRLEREITSHRRVDHENVVKLFDAHTVEIDGKTLVALDFEYINGGSLWERMSADLVDNEELKKFASGLLSGIKALHDANLLHRDLKPENIGLRDRDLASPVILDLGLAKLLDVDSITRYPALLGSAMYMSPEQLRGERALKASDLWAAGVIILELATGRHPFFSEGMSLHVDEALRIITREPSVPDGLSIELSVLIRKLVSDPAYRRGNVNKALRTIKGK